MVILQGRPKPQDTTFIWKEALCQLGVRGHQTQHLLSTMHGKDAAISSEKVNVLLVHDYKCQMTIALLSTLPRQEADKIHVVFDCSADYKRESLNKYLLTGPDLTNGLVGVLCQFRRDPVAFMCDLEAMFHQFKVDKRHRNLLWFLWWPDGDIKAVLVEYRMTVHLLGAGSSPGCANFALKRIATDHEEEFGHNGANFVRDNFYVDNDLKSVSTVTETIKLIESTLGLRPHKFTSNSRKS